MNCSYMETLRLKYFMTIAETGSLTKAAQVMGISHSGLSKAVSALETETKLKLFRPLGRGLEITPEGKWFYVKAREILRIADEVMRGRERSLPVIRIGMSGALAMTCAGLFAAEFKEAMVIDEMEFGQAEASILNGDLDFALVFTLSPKPELEYLELGEVRFGSFAREDLAARLAAVDIPFAVPSSDYPFNPLGFRNRDGWPSDIPRRPRFSVNSFAIALDLLRSGQAAVYMPEFVAALETKNGAKIFGVKDHIAAASKRKLFLVKRQAAEESAAMKKVGKIARRVCARSLF